MLSDYFNQVQEAARFLKKQGIQAPKVAVVLSGGLGQFVHGVKNPKTFSSDQIPHFPKARVEGHKGEFIFGEWDRMPLVVLKGRNHYYEGLSPQEVVFPYFVLRELGATMLITTNAVGGLRLDLNAGDIMVVEDHINMMGTNPLIGLSVVRPKDQFPSMQKAYDEKLITLAQEVARGLKIELKKGVYLGNPGPSYETAAECKMFRSFGADTVGMSTVFEVIAARFLKMRVLTLNIIANISADRHAGVMQHTEVLETMKKAEGNVVRLLEGLVGPLAKLP